MQEKKFFMGLDEAGRGPVIGPMVIAGIVMDISTLDSLVAMGVTDSKVLTPRSRERLFKTITDEAHWFKTFVVWPDVIDEHVNRKALNILECDIFSMLIDSFSDEAEVFIDSPLKPDVLKKMISDRIRTKKTLHCSFKADLLYPVVSAASIIAKVTRDMLIEELKLVHGDFGSGYPSDKKTVRYIDSIKKTSGKEAPYFVRRSWKTFKQGTLAL